MTTPVARPADRVVVPALGTTALLAVTDPAALPTAEVVLRSELAAIDAACSRFRPDSEISRLHEQAGRAVPVGPLLAEALAVALQAAERTGGLVDPTVGAAVRGLGYDRTFAELDLDEPTPAAPAVPAPGWWRVSLEPVTRTVLLPRGVELDLGATAKALAADRIAASVAFATGSGVLVSLGGDAAVAGPAPHGGWPLAVGDDHERALTSPDAVVTIAAGGLASSGTTRRAWRRAGRDLHHIVDPRTGDVAPPHWRTVTVAAADCVDANTASTAAIVLGPDAPGWLAERELPARLVAADGAVTTVAGFPEGR
ncbi:FAD:protein FMN transferase [Pseudonocardia sp. CA-107938]|uniref:FAD:protein FMN transferase n=1 Tax=Pseudonocardia sp. CA-107938 TaxID=3240021 RepID=UPI003D8EE369